VWRPKVTARLAPSLQALLAGFGQVELLGAAIRRGRFDPDQPVALKRQHVATLHGSAVAIASARFIPEILSTGNAIDVRF
jgi:hypothetical protein